MTNDDPSNQSATSPTNSEAVRSSALLDDATQEPRPDYNERRGPVGVGGARAFEVVVKHWIPEHSGIYAATSAAKAKFASWRAAHDAGFDSITFGQLRVRRAPEFDAIATKLKHGVDRECACLLKWDAERKAGGGGAEHGDEHATQPGGPRSPSKKYIPTCCVIGDHPWKKTANGRKCALCGKVRLGGGGGVLVCGENRGTNERPRSANDKDQRPLAAKGDL